MAGEKKPSRTGKTRVRRRVLVVDDNPHMLGLIGDILEYLGYQMLTATEGRAALKIIQRERVPVALVDVRMPKMDGITILKEIRKNRYPTEVIFVTGFGSEDCVKEGAAWGAFDCIGKPFKVEQIKSVLDKCFQMAESDTELTRLERESRILSGLVKQYEEKEKHSKQAAAGGFVEWEGIMSFLHDLQNHLAVLGGSHRILKKHLKSGSDKAKAAASLEKNLNEMAEALLEFGRSAHEPGFGFSPLEPKSLVNQTVDWLRSKIPANIKVIIKIPKSAPRIYGSPPRLRQAFANLILNSVEAMPDGGKLTVCTRRVKKAGKTGVRYLWFDFRDCGVGIPKNEFCKIFVPFHSSKEKGRGLGLAVTKKIIEDHAGEISLTSEVHRGTTFTVKLPVKEGGRHGIQRKSSNRRK